MTTYDPPTLAPYNDLPGLKTRPLTPMTISELRTRNELAGETFFKRNRSGGAFTRRTFSHVRMAVRYVPDDFVNGYRTYIKENGHIFCSSEAYRPDPYRTDTTLKLWHMNLQGKVNFVMSVTDNLSVRQQLTNDVYIGRNDVADVLYEVNHGNLTAASKLLVKAWAANNPPVKE